MNHGKGFFFVSVKVVPLKQKAGAKWIVKSTPEGEPV